jgi:hypothetical protein
MITVLCLATSITLAAAEDHQPTISAMPLVVERAEIMPADPTGRAPRQVAVEVRNASSRTVVAWGVEVRIVLPGGMLRRATTATDGYESAARVLPGDPTLRPGARHTLMVDIPWRVTDEPLSASAIGTYAIFDNDTAVGDDKSIAFRFAQRALDRRVWQLVEETIDHAAVGVVDAPTVLRLTQETLEAVSSEDIRGSVTFRHVQQRIGVALKRTQPSALPHFLSELRAEARALRAAAAAHSVRR